MKVKYVFAHYLLLYLICQIKYSNFAIDLNLILSYEQGFTNSFLTALSNP